MTDGKIQLTRGDAVLIASRIAAAYFLASAFYVLSYLPEHIYSLSNHIGDYSVMNGPGFWRNYYFLLLAFDFVRGFVSVLLGITFYKCGPGVRDFFFPPGQEREVADVR
jgi:uncharacterized membrane protein YozB (DUF420 family)